MKKYFILCLIIISYVNHYSQPMPLSLGNSWVWEGENGTRHKVTIIDSGVVFNGKRYFTSGSGSYARYDDSDSIYYYVNMIDSQEVAYYKKGINTYDTINFLYYGLPSFFYLESEIPAIVFDSLVTIKWVSYDYFGLVRNDRLWTEEFGMLSERDAVTGTVFSTLLGCVIDGKVYGDTVTVSVDDYLTEVPNQFKLYQNYPNPFNPTTVISWQSPVGSWQTLKVYDVLGNEVATLVNEYREAGSYKVEFSTGSIGNASELPSGVYYYKLSVGNFSDVKKMMLIK
ncbi:T9SS type A sorting domain-containing protein [Ignavibacterium sp.]|uniref:T9SS type A sorting domain-containing protein n=1 Tax=Ignavibacterium sp. TaxID=2651167 RepID=UPI0021FC35CB|nr:T9SS type A sorting domain-containing protein [Ignavibacterium sp.]BDQ03630.1 MAG: hypothetical protein KatS3mg037_2205 [Ignavibacterium sp.]